MKRWQKGLLALGALCLLATSRFACQRVAERGRFASAFSTYGSGPSGTRALFLLAQELGARPQRWAQDLAALPKGAMLVAASDCATGMARPLSRYEAQELMRWVEQGGVLLVAGAREYLPKGIGVGFEPEEGCEKGKAESEGEGEEEDGEAESEPEFEPEPEDETETETETGTGSGTGTEAGVPLGDERLVWISPAARPLLGLEALPMREPGRLVVDPKAEADVILSMPDAPGMPESPVERPMGVVVARGKGRVIALASGSLFQNRSLGTADGGVLFSRLLATYAPRGPVLFDEYHLGVGERRSLMRYLRQAGATPFVVQLLFVALLWLWRSGARFGGLRTPQTAQARGTASFVSALGGLFARAGDAEGARQVLVRQALAQIARHYHVPPAAPRKLADELDARGRHDAAAAVRELEMADGAGRRSLAAQSRTLDQLVARACR